MEDYSKYLVPLDNKSKDEEDQTLKTSDYSKFLVPIDAPPLEVAPKEGIRPDPTDLEATQEVTKELRVSDLTEDDVFKKIAPYMKSSKGMEVGDKYTRKDIADSFVNEMRSLEIGNSITTFNLFSYVNGLKGMEDTRERDKRLIEMHSAMKTFDQLNNAFGKGTTTGEKVDAVWDYAYSLIVDPVNIVTLGIGKLATGGATKAASEAAKYTTRQLALEAVKKQGATKAAMQAVDQQARLAVPKILKEGIYKTSGKQITAKQIAGREALAAGITDTVTGVGIDAVYQQIRQDVDLQTEYSMTQGALAAAGGMFGVGLGYKFARGSAPTEEDIAALGGVRYFNAINRIAEARKIAGKPSDTIKDLDLPGFEDTLPNLASQLETLADKAARGESIRIKTDTGFVPEDLVWLSSFFDGVSNALADNGVKYWTKRTDTDGFTNWLGDLMNEMPKEVQGKLEDIFQNSLGKHVDMYKGTRLFPKEGEALDTFKESMESAFGVIANDVRTSAQKMAFVNKASRTFNKLKEIKPEAKPDELMESFVDAELLPAGKRLVEKITAPGRSLQNNLVRMLVTNPSTTALNLIGWQTASTMQSLTDVVRGTLYGGGAVLNTLMFNKPKASDYAKQSALMFGLQKVKVHNLLDPEMTLEQFKDVVAFHPEVSSKLMKYMSGGIDMQDIRITPQVEEFAALAQEALGEAGPGVIKRSAVDKFMDGIQTVYGVKAQDIITKSQEFMYAVDKRIRLKYGKTYREFLQDENLWKYMNGQDYAELMSAAADDALQLTYSKSYKDNTKFVGQVAGAIEDLRRVPILGAMAPFGQFFNNTLAHMMNHTGISFAHKYFTTGVKDEELAIKAAVGMTFAGMMYTLEKDNLGEPLFVERDRDGQLRDRTYDFPYNLYKATGRMIAHYVEEGSIPEPMYNEFVRTFGVGSFTRQLDQSVTGVFDMVKELFTTEDVEVKEQIGEILKSSASMYVSGYTRFMEPVNLTVAAIKGDAYITPDRKQGSAWVNNSVRYMDSILESLNVYQRPEARKSITDQAPLGVPLAKILGYRQANVPTALGKAMNEAGIPNWQTGLKSNIAKAKNDMAGVIRPIIEVNINERMETEAWLNGSSQVRKAIIDHEIRYAIKKAKDILRESIDPDDRRSVLMYELGSGVYANKKRLEKYKKEIGFTEDIETLELEDLEILVLYVKNQETQRIDTQKGE